MCIRDRESQNCGLAYFGVAGTDMSLGLGAHGCNRQPGYTFGHEIGHMFGCGHDIELGVTNALYAYGHGARILPPGTGERFCYF